MTSDGTLPVDSSSFVGRRREVHEVRSLLARSRLVTLTGVGGVGKTRLAIEVARRLRASVRDGAWLVDLAPLAAGSEVAEAVATSIGVVERSTRQPAEKLVRHLRRRQMLVVLDNCEHVLDSCAALVDLLLSRAPGLRVLATSRRGLQIAGEQIYEVAPLTVPEPGRSAGVDGLRQYDAVTLLLERASARDLQFALTEHNHEAVAALCTTLDGIPLAIELAATRLRSLSPETLLGRLEDRFALLTAGSRAALPRQQTLRALIDWSYGLCSPRERLLWEQLSAFSGGFDLEAAESVCPFAELPAEAILDLLDGLVAQSIVSCVDRSGGRRYRMLETIRQYGLQRLTAAGRESTIRRRHRRFYLRRAQRISESWCGPDQEAGLTRLRADHDNLRAAFQHCLSESDPRDALELAVALRQHWYADIFLGEGRRWLDEALALPRAPAHARVRALWVAAWVSLLQGDGVAAAARLGECQAVAARISDRTSAGFATSLEGTAALFAGQLPAAIDRFERGIHVLHQSGNTMGELIAGFQLAIALAHGEEAARAAEVCRRTVALSEAHDERWARSYALWAWGYASWRQGDADAAAERARAALAIQRDFADPVGAALIIELLAWIAGSERRHRDAVRHLALAECLWQRVGTGIAAFGPHHLAHHERCRARSGEALGDGAVEAAVLHAQELTVAEAIDRALGHEDAEADASAGVSAPELRGPLTRREWEVARLLATGRTNRAIADMLVVSPRTVDGHVERILAKLGFRSRAQVAAWVGEHVARARDGEAAARPAASTGS